MAGRQLRVGEFVRLNAHVRGWFEPYLGKTNLGRIFSDSGYGRQSRYVVEFLTDTGGLYPLALPRTDLVVAKLTATELAAWLERELTK
jgi:hypothetical protein